MINTVHKTGSQALALAAADDDVAKEMALELYESKTMATSSVASHAARWTTWVKMHKRWFGEGTGAIPVLPLTPETLRAVAAMLISGNYRSTGHYVSRAKDEHCKTFGWTSMLAREQRRAALAAKRGIGPAHQSAELPLHAVVALNLDKDCLTPNGPLDFTAYVVVASFFVLREIEASLMVCGSVVVDRVLEKITVELPVSKTDPGALACKRSWGCVCGGDRSQPCAFHFGADHMDFLIDRFAVDGALPPGLPFFPGISGEAVDKATVVTSVEAVASRLSLPLKATDGRNAFGGHVFRVSGARHLAAVGMDPRVIMVHARWQSNVVLRYVQEAPLVGLTDTYRRLTAPTTSTSSSSSSWLAPVAAQAPQLGERIRVAEVTAEQARKMAEENAETTTEMEGKINVMQTALEDLRGQLLPKYVISRYGGTHIVGNNWCHIPTSAWKAACGWAYGGSSFHRSPVPGTVVEQHCPRCFRAVGEA